MEVKLEVFILKDNTFRNLKVIYLFNLHSNATIHSLIRFLMNINF